MTEPLPALAIAVLFINCALLIGIGSIVLFNDDNLLGDLHIIIGFSGFIALFYLTRINKPKVEAQNR